MLTLLAWLLGIDPGQIPTGSEWGIAWRNLPELWVIFLVLLPFVLVATTWIYRHEGNSATRGAKVLLGALRAFVLVLLLVILFEPVLSVETQTTNETTVLFLIDSSLSMSVKDRLPKEEARRKAARVAGIVSKADAKLTLEETAELDRFSRIELVNRGLANTELGVLDNIKKRHRVQVYSFAGGLVRDPEIGKMKADGNESGIGDAIVSALKESQSQIVVAIVLITDGRNTKGVNPVNLADTVLSHDYAVPVYAIGVGNPSEPKDVEVKRFEGPDVALAKDFVVFNFTVVSRGYDAKEVEVVLQQGSGNENDRVVERKTITLEGQGREQEVTIQYKPEEKGEYTCTVSIPPQDEELVVENNSSRRIIQIVDEKIKILYVDGYPRWEYRYLKNALVRDTSVEVKVLLQSADAGFPQEGTRNVTPITEFPSELKDLLAYDVILFGDVDPNGPYMSQFHNAEDTMKNIVEFVQDFGGGLAMIAGMHDSPRSYRGTPLGKILPIVPSDDSPDTAPITNAIQVRLTPLGREHPITKLELDPQANEELWEDHDGRRDGLAPIFWYCPVKKVKPGAQVLVARAGVGDSNQDPLVVVQQVGRGRTLFVATDETWRWRFVRGDRYFYAFWREALNYLRGGRLLGSKRFEIHTKQPEYSPNDNVIITARVYNEEFRPEESPTYACELEPPGLQPFEVDLKAVPKKPGRYEGTTKAAELGDYHLSIGPQGLGGDKERASTMFRVVVPNREFENPSMDSDSLTMVAEKTHGRFLPFYDLDQLAPLIQRRGEVTSTMLNREFDLWDSPLIYLLFTALITGEWVLRKRFRLL